VGDEEFIQQALGERLRVFRRDGDGHAEAVDAMAAVAAARLEAGMNMSHLREAGLHVFYHHGGRHGAGGFLPLIWGPIDRYLRLSEKADAMVEWEKGCDDNYDVVAVAR
jgi:hypothetical protein